MMTKKDLKLLENIFSREIEGTLPFQSKSKEYKRLENEGMVEFVSEMRHFNDGLPPLEISGWILTHKGRFAYCSNCYRVRASED